MKKIFIGFFMMACLSGCQTERINVACPDNIHGYTSVKYLHDNICEQTTYTVKGCVMETPKQFGQPMLIKPLGYTEHVLTTCSSKN